MIGEQHQPEEPATLEIRATFADGRAVTYEYPHGISGFMWNETSEFSRNPHIELAFTPKSRDDGEYARITHTSPKDN